VSTGLKLCFRELQPDEGMVAFAQRLYRDHARARGPRARPSSCAIWLARDGGGAAVRAHVQLACRERSTSGVGEASARDAYRALTAAFEAAMAELTPV
jgi:hypothetical protein